MNPVYAIVIVTAFIALGELVSIWSKARVPSLLVAMLGIFVVAKAGLVPQGVIDDSLLLQVYTITTGPLLFHMGTLLPLRQLLQQWRSVIITFAAMLVAVLAIVAVVTPLFGFATSVAGAGPLAGGIVATGLTTQGLVRAGLTGSVLVVPSMVLMLQSLPTMPLTNFLLRRHAQHLIDSGELLKHYGQKDDDATDAEEHRSHRTLVTMPESLVDNHLFMLFVVCVGGALATFVAGLTQVPSSIVALVFGVIAAALGLAPQRALEKANSFGIAMAAIIALVMAPLVKASLADVLAAIVPTLVILVIGVIGILIGGIIATKLLKLRVELGMAVSLTATYGFPADYLLTHEVARSVGRTTQEREALVDAMLAPMLVGGFASVSVGSVVIASIMVGLL
ncbi:hypothetical protein [Nigerium massiliense]|uniref:hypothetical protein n=1 Tax=Nigerium massiliense TaxID=1522317 RepID=UPI00058D3181|nr:hypothetical protein [Nigerium massiliense]